MRIRFTHFRSSALLCLVAAGCATAGGDASGPSTLALTRPDGGSVVCTRPPEAWLDSQGGVGVAAALPDIVQQLVGGGGKAAGAAAGPSQGGAPPQDTAAGGAPPTGMPPSRSAPSISQGTEKKSGDVLDAVVQTAPNPQALDVLNYRLCLAYGKGILSRDVYVHWLLDLRPRAFAAVRHRQGDG